MIYVNKFGTKYSPPGITECASFSTCPATWPFRFRPLLFIERRKQRLIFYRAFLLLLVTRNIFPWGISPFVDCRCKLSCFYISSFAFLAMKWGSVWVGTTYESPVKIHFSSTNTYCKGQSTELRAPAADKGSVEPASLPRNSGLLCDTEHGRGGRAPGPDASGRPRCPLHVLPTLPTSFLWPPVASASLPESQLARGAGHAGRPVPLAAGL